jgi:predicted enzyme related to lactoylglutathione lyase
MIRGIHGMLYSTDPAATRAFFRDVVKLPGNDIGGGWWIFDLPEGDLGFHPAAPGDEGVHDVSFYCDDIHATVAALESRGASFTGDVEDHGYGLVTHFTAPGGIKVQLYEPRYAKQKARNAGAKAAARKAGTKKAAKKKSAPKKTAKKKSAKKAKR